MPGPVPKRSEERTRRNRPENEGGVPLVKGVALPTEVPETDPNWHPRAAEWFESLDKSGMREFYQQSDWATAQIIADALTEYYKRPTAMMLATIMQAMTNLGTTEGERRRMRIELETPKEYETPARVTAINSYRDQLGL